ncbi:FlgB family protein [Thalassococcus sp. CAU 1522]|uniref:FlgB family protein n=1 Tax=Thalassococcus arenae TaxID=2851652 RepID=A0ABS6N5Q2_9RHOB|nr:FlgB family protein [Thalassococcus arenae]MBV2359331.1 FlgB family protein [Thalassococcus arenae]
MFQDLTVFRTAMAMARHAGHQQALSAQNIANADTPGYRALEMPDFASVSARDAAAQKATRTKHLNGSSTGAWTATERRDAQDPNGNTVSLEREMLEAVGAKRQHDRALAIYRSSLSVLRASLGRQ